jgi:predicted phosphodiesterase
VIAIISDIHGNLEALQAVLAEMRNAELIYCAGDIVGYGPNPNECCELIRERGVRAVQGNHDFVCANMCRLNQPDDSFTQEDRELCRRLFEQKNAAAKAASLWTSKVLAEENVQFLRGLPLVINEHGLTILHGRPGAKADMLNEYMLRGLAQQDWMDQIEGRVLVVGHSHIPMQTPRVVNPGSVGQPRDRNWQASFAMLQDAWYRFSYISDEDLSFRIVNQLVRFHRVPYDVKRTIRKIKQISEVPGSLGDRLTVGL